MALIETKIKKLSLLFLLMLGVICLFPQNVMADEKKPSNVVGFNYSVDYPENQIGGNNGYFDLLLEPGAEQIVTITLSNPSDKNVVVNVLANSTKTNSNGVLEYGPIEIEKDASLKFDFEEIVKVPESVELSPGDVKKIDIQIKMPKTSFEGMILGGIQLKKTEQEDETDKSEGATVKNEYAYLIAMSLVNKADKVAPEFKVNKAYASQKNYRNTININLSNITASLNKNNTTIEAQIMKKGSDEVLYERKQAALSFAPNSQIDFPVSMNGEAMVPGDYSANVLVSIGEKKWQELLEFEITKDQADTFNRRDVGLVQDRGLDMKLVALIVGGVLATVVILFIIVQLVKKKKQAKLEMNKKSSKRKSSGTRKKR